MSHKLTTESSEIATHTKRRHLPAWLVGAFIGITVWSIALAGLFGLEEYGFSDSVLIGIIHTACLIVVGPIASLGWFLVWGDNGPPFPWIDSIAFNIVTGMIIAATFGAVGGKVSASLIRSRQFTIKSLLIATAIVAVIVWAGSRLAD